MVSGGWVDLMTYLQQPPHRTHLDGCDKASCQVSNMNILLEAGSFSVGCACCFFTSGTVNRLSVTAACRYWQLKQLLLLTPCRCCYTHPDGISRAAAVGNGVIAAAGPDTQLTCVISSQQTDTPGLAVTPHRWTCW
jgi:hypothetical protein